MNELTDHATLTADQKLATAKLVADYIGGDAGEYVDLIIGTCETVKDFCRIAETIEDDDDYGHGFILEGV